jgi:NitT/TauT family transport system substrate-binding protein
MLRQAQAMILVLGMVSLDRRRGGRSREIHLTIAVGGKTTLYYLPLTIAEQLGYFKDEGLTVEIQIFPQSRSLQALLGGSADVVREPTKHHRHADQCPALEAFVLQGTNPGISLASRQGRRLFLAEGPKGMRGCHCTWLQHADDGQPSTGFVGLTPDDVSIVGVGTGAQAIAAMRSGELDAISNVDPVMMLLEKQGLIKIVNETTTAKGAREVFGGSLPAACLYAKRSFVEHNPHTIQALTNAIVRALKWLTPHARASRADGTARIPVRRSHVVSGCLHARPRGVFPGWHLQRRGCEDELSGPAVTQCGGAACARAVFE